MANFDLRDRGSRKHILDLLSTHEYQLTLNAVLRRPRFRLADFPYPQPYGREDRKALAEFEVEEYFADSHRQIPGLEAVVADWWITHRATNGRRPCFDLIARLCSLDDSADGLLLVEAKAHTSEAKIADSKGPPNDSQASRENDARIKRRIGETRTILNRLGAGATYLTTDSHYQLANRLAYSTHLANLGYSVVLLYLGFLGDTYFLDHLIDRDHWQRVMGGYFQGVLPQALPERWHTIGTGRLFIAVDALPVLEISSRPGAAS